MSKAILAFLGVAHSQTARFRSCQPKQPLTRALASPAKGCGARRSLGRACHAMSCHQAAHLQSHRSPGWVCHDDLELAQDAEVKVAHVTRDPLRLLQRLREAGGGGFVRVRAGRGPEGWEAARVAAGAAGRPAAERTAGGGAAARQRVRPQAELSALLQMSAAASGLHPTCMYCGMLPLGAVSRPAPSPWSSS